jgi:WD40 repeat protein
VGGNRLEFSSDGKLLVVGGFGGFRFFDLASGKETGQITAGPARGDVFAVSADGKLLASGGRGFGRKNPVVVSEVKTGKQIATLEPSHTGQIGLALSSDGKWLAVWGTAWFTGRENRDEQMKIARTVELYNPTTGKSVKKVLVDENDSLGCAAFSPDKKTLALATAAGSIQLWDIAAGKKLQVWRGPAQMVRSASLTFSPDGKMLVVGNRHGESAPLVWDVVNGWRLRQGRAPRCQFQGVGFPGKGRILAWGTRFQTLVVWELTSGKQFTPTVGHLSSVTGLAFRRDGRIRSAGGDSQVIEWDQSGKLLRRLPEPRLDPNDFRRFQPSGHEDAVFSPDGNYLALSGRFGQNCAVRDVQAGEEVFSVPRNFSPTPVLPAFSPDGKLLALPTTDQKRSTTVLVVRVDSGAEAHSCALGAASPTALAFSPTGKRLAVVSGGQFGRGPSDVRLWRLDGKGEDADFKPAALPAAFGNRAALSFAPDGNLLAVADAQGTVHLLNARTGNPVEQLSTGQTISRGPLFSPDGRSVAVTITRRDGSGETLTLWETGSGKKRWSVELPALTTALAFAPSGRVLATGHTDSSALLWDVSGRLTERGPVDATKIEGLWKELAGDADKAFAAQRRLAAAGERGVARLRLRLRPATGKPLDEATLARLVKQLDDDEFEVRQKAFDALVAQGRAAEGQLRKALENKPSVEVKKRANDLLARLERHTASAEENQAGRAVEVLEWLDSPAARKLLDELARGRADAVMTRQAKAALARLRLARP